VADTILISNKGAKPSPNDYTLPANLNFEPSAVTALFNGTAAASSFLACLSFYSQDGLLLARTFPGTTIAAGGSAEVTFGPFLGGDDVQVPISAVPSVGLVRSAVQTIATGAAVAIAWDTVTANNFGMWDAGAPTRVTCTNPGAYAASYELAFAANATGDRAGRLRLNGAGVSVAQMILNTNTQPGAQTIFTASTVQLSLAVGDYFELIAAHDAGVNLDVIASLGVVREFSA
jgi:hypothetical protein